MLIKKILLIILLATSYVLPAVAQVDIEKENISREEMASMTKGLSVPQIVINSKPIGGFEDLLEYFK